MRFPIVLAVGALLAGTAIAHAGDAAPSTSTRVQTSQPFEMSAAKRKKRTSGQQAYGQSGQQIACTQFGCGPIPRSCRIRTGYNPFTWNPSGFDEVVCPYR